MKATFTFDAKKLKSFNGSVNATISKVGRGTKKATEAACKEILQRSLDEVPSATGTLASSASYRIAGNYRTGFYGDVGYCIDKDPINPKTGEAASEYALAVHENLYAVHPNGKAKFLEDPVNAYAADNFPRTVMEYVGEEFRGAGGKT